MEQVIINGLGAVLLLAIGYLLNTVNTSITSLQSKIQALEVLVASKYVLREEYRQDLNNIWTSLRNIENLLRKGEERE